MGKLYAAQTVALDAGRMAGAALAFPVIVHGAQPLTWAIVLGSVSTIVPLLCRPVWRTYAQLGTLGH